MSKQNTEINDDEIRVISSSRAENNDKSKNTLRKKVLCSVIAAAVLMAIAAMVYLIISNNKNSASEPDDKTITYAADTIVEKKSPGYVTVKDTVIDGVTLKMLSPENLNPFLHIGNDVLSDESVKMILPAADIREDNGEIVGAYVMNGDLISKGQSKAGFCAIINGKLTIGVADATSLLEQAIETEGYFFRQYPLVVGSQIVENKPKGKSQRKALAEINGLPIVVLSEDPLTFHDFSQCLVDLGATNAIYLVGSNTYGFAYDSNGNKFEFGDSTSMKYKYSNYIVWK